MGTVATPPEYAVLLAELDRGQLDGNASRALRARRDPFAHLFHAVAIAGTGRFAEARTAVDEALRVAPSSGLAHLVAGIVRYVTRDYDSALAALDRAVELTPRAASQAYRLAVTRASRLGWDADARDTLDRARALEPRNLRWHLEAARVHANARNHRDALLCMQSSVELEQGSATLWMELARLAALEGKTETAGVAVRRSLALAERDVRYPLEAAHVLGAIGELDEALRVLSRAAEDYPEDARVHSELAERALWSLDLTNAEARARDALAWGEDHAPAHRVLGACERLRSNHESALAHLDRAIEADASEYRAHVFRAEALLELRRHMEAHDALTRASMCADGFLPVAWVLRMLVSLDAGEPDPKLTRDRFGEIGELLRAIDPRADGVMADGDHGRVRGLLERALAALGGNRSTTPTTIGSDGSVSELPRLHGVRFESRKALELVRARSPRAALVALGRVVDRFEAHALPECHRGELLLWLGRLDEARASLERAIAIHPRTRWAYIGLTGIDILEGHSERALATSARGVTAMNGTEGPAVYVYRGEALRRLGRLDDALADLRRACELHPSRAGARINLVLALIGQGGDASEHLSVLHEQASGLLSDAARELGIVLYPSRDTVAETPDVVRVLERALEMMRGNRSSSTMTYFTAAGRIRYVPHWPHGGRGPHDTDRDDLEQARTLLMRATGLSQGPPPDRRARSKPARVRTSVDEALVATFLSRGYVHLESCFPRDVATEWTVAASRRIRHAPQKYVKGYDPTNSAHDLSRFDPSHPSTWTWERIDVEGDETVLVAEFAPRAWDAMCVLLGSEDRVATTRWSQYFIINLSERADDVRDAPGPDWPSWHFDDPSERARLDDYRNGLIAICLFSDVAPRSGGTWVLADSPAHTARLLEERPEGLNMVAAETALRVAGECNRFVELTGRAGDVFLLHPFMLHSSSPNPSGRPRWISNPMIYVKEPLRFDRAAASEYSPVELLVARALGRV